MDKILIYSGTTEGKKLAYSLAASGLFCDVCVATEYGRQVMQESEYIKILEGRMDSDAMAELYRKNNYCAVIDATHPFATEVTANIKKSLKGTDIKYYRLLRGECKKVTGNLDDEPESGEYNYYDNSEDCIAGLLNSEGRILLTTGSKELGAFCENEILRSRIVARVLPGLESVKLCYDAGLEGRQIIAMQGPFSTEMNLAQIREYGISHIVTKESGSIGGTDNKCEAARLANIECHIIRRPNEETISDAFSLEELLNELEKVTSTEIIPSCQLSITLAGIGMGDSGSMTLDTKKAITDADYLFGSPRLTDGIMCKGRKYPYYLAKDILPVLDDIERSTLGEAKVAILFSGDTGFYSGCEKLYKELKARERYEITISPGISSLAAMSARLGIGWQDCRVISTHGVDVSIWEQQLIHSVRYNKKTFVLTSGIADVNRIGELLQSKANLHIFMGYRLSYGDEQVSEITALECINKKENGLYVLVIINDRPEMEIIVPHIKDEEFIRADVPMTKEAVRHLSVCRLELTKDAIVYDIGAGTGSVSVEIASLSPDIHVYAIESEHKAIDLIEKNLEAAGLNNVTVVEGMAPAAMDGLPVPTHAFIGGSRGRLNDILEKLRELNPYIRVVINAVSMETIAKINALLDEYGVVDAEITQLSVNNTKKIGGHTMLNANNPVFVVAFNMPDRD